MARGLDGPFEPLSSRAHDGATNVPDSTLSALHRMVAELVFETTNEGIWLIDAQARTTFVNRHAAELLGYAEDEMIGRLIFEFMDEARIPLAEANLKRRRQSISDRHAVPLRRKDGSVAWVIGSANPVFDRRGRYAGALALLRDLSAQKQREQQLEAESADLKQALAEAQRRAERAIPPEAPASPLGAAIRGAVAVAACGTFLGTVALLTARGVVSTLASYRSSDAGPAGLDTEI